MKSINTTIPLHNGVEMPQFGLGVYLVEDGEEVFKTVETALNAGYRSIDTAAFYNNEVGVGKAIHASRVKREDLFVTTKVWNSDQGYEETIRAFETSLNNLQLDYLDLYLIHWPVEDKFVETWQALQHLYEQNKVRAIGVSNFQIHHLEQLFKTCEIKPMVNQIELHPLLSQQKLRTFCQDHNIKIEAWSPLARGRILDNEQLQEIASEYNKTVAQIILRWHLQLDNIIIPKSVTSSRIIENANIFDFQLTTEEMTVINNLNINERFGPDPDNFDF